MPVRFRCKHCQQLLGIAHRKIGTEVRCPECRKMVWVPAEDAPEFEEPTRKRDVLSEAGDGDGRPQPPVVGAAVEPLKEVRAPKVLPAAVESFDAELYRLPDAARVGVVLTPLHTLLLCIGALVILALAFAVGLLVGRFVL